MIKIPFIKKYLALVDSEDKFTDFKGEKSFKDFLNILRENYNSPVWMSNISIILDDIEHVYNKYLIEEKNE